MVIGAAEDVLVDIAFNSCSPVDFVIAVAVDAIVVVAVVMAPNTFPECLKVCFRMTSLNIHKILLSYIIQNYLIYTYIKNKSYFQVPPLQEHLEGSLHDNQ